MGFGRWIWVQKWAFLLAVCCIHQIGAQIEIQQEAGSKDTEVVQQKQNISSKVNIIQPMLTNPVITPSNPAHNGRVCSTWGNFHFKTFDGDIFSFPGLCNYVFSSHCNAPYEDFNIQIRRIMEENAVTVNRITMKLEGVAAELTKGVVMINSNRVQLPYSQSGILIEKSGIYVKVVSKMGIVLMWNEDDSILLELNEKYVNQTCGLCGDFNGFPIYNEFYSNNIKMTALEFGNMQKMDGPTEYCEDSTSTLPNNCTDNFDDICQRTLTSSPFAECNDLVDVREYIMICQDDLCRSEKSKNASCICHTFAEYSRQCAHAGGHPLNWRTSKLCPKKCPYNMQYQECSSPCADTCTNPERSQFCEEHCMDGCFCPPGTVFDDVNNSGCIPHEQCSCVYNGNTYAPGTSFSEQCHSCTCNGGQWSCQDMSCPGTCSVEGGSHISTYDKKHYDHHGDCTYVLSKHCKDETFTILVELRKCGITDTETCLKTVTLRMNNGQTLIEVRPDGGVFVNSIYTHLPFSAANATVFRPSSFFIIIQTNFGVLLEIQIIPIMQVYVRLDPIFKNKTCGLCGNFNNIQTDDFKVISGIIEGTATAFANTWKTQASCPNIQHSFENPCALSIDNEKYAQHWCGLLTDSKGPFADCHYAVNPSVYHTNCMFDTCNCANSEDCLCAALSSYVRACAAKGIQLHGWRTDVCSKYTTSCPKSLSYSYTISSCQPTCRSLSEPDVICNIRFVPVDGCTCVNGTYMDDSGKCVPAHECPCYYKGSPIPFGVVHENGLLCTCIQGRLNCIGAPNPNPVCESPMVYFDCTNTTAGTIGAECQKSCQTLDMQCYSTQCVSGCVCPAGLVSDGNGGCIPEEECPCIHNEAMYQPGEKIIVDCNTCFCKNRKWECTEDQCLGTCAVYGDGHYNTFDDTRFSFNGNCEYTLVQDHCGRSGRANGTFRVITENIPCGNTGTTCSKSIKVFLESYELILGEEHVSVVKTGQNGKVPYTVRYMGMYLVIETTSGLILMWDKKTTLFIKLSPNFKGQICGLCGNYDGNGINDFTTRSQSVVENVLEFGNSWKVSSTCPDANNIKDPCSTNPYRKSWSEKQCSIINSNVFAACHSQVEPAKYYQACVTDACACDTGGDCDCFCTAVAAYAQACSEVGACIAWRTPSICPLFCDYYNQQGECEWHYKPCGASCMKTCRNPSGKCFHNFPGLEGCYPNCPPEKPYFHEDQMKCVSLCDCYDTEDGKIYRRDECKVCECTSEGLQCKFDEKACHCIYEGQTYKYGELIYSTTDGTGWCFSATCDVNGAMSRNFFRCQYWNETTTPFPSSTIQSTTTTSVTTTVCVKKVCAWSEWYDCTQPENREDSGDYETFENLRNKGHTVCEHPDAVQCRAKEHPDIDINNLNQTVECSQTRGLTCNNTDQQSKQCYNYEIRISCCSYIPCSEIQPTTPRTTEKITTAVNATRPSTQTIKPTPETTTTESQKNNTQTPPAKEPTPQTEISHTTKTSAVSTTAYQTKPITPKTSTLATETTTTPTTTYITSPPPVTTTTGSTAVPSPTTMRTESTTIITPTRMSIITPTSTASTIKTSPLKTQTTINIITPTAPVPTSASSTTSTSRTTPRSTTITTTVPAPTETSTATTRTTISTTTASTTSHPPVTTTTTGTTAVPSPTVTPTERTTTTTPTTTASTTRTSPTPTSGETTTSTPTATVPTSPSSTTSTSRTTPGRTTMSKTISAHTETSTMATKTITSNISVSTAKQTIMTITAGTTVVSSPTALPINIKTAITSTTTASTTRTSPLKTPTATITITPTQTVPTSSSSTTSTSRTTPGSTTTPTTTSAHTETSTVTSKTPTSTTTASTTSPLSTTTTGTTAVPSPTATPTERTTNTTSTSTSSTTRTSPTPTTGATTSTPTSTVLTPASSTTSTSSTTPGSTTTPTTTSAHTETSTVTIKTPTSTTTASTISHPPATTTTTGTTAVPSPTLTPTERTTTTTPTTTASTTSISPTSTPTSGTMTSTPTPTVPTTSPTSPSHIPHSTTSCCAWTQWFDVDSPQPGSENGDIETFAKIRAAGYDLCDKPQGIECRAKDYPDRDLDKLGQKFECSLDAGLVCRNKDQIKKYPMCFNYEIRVLCCDRDGCTTASPPTTSAGPSTTVSSTETSTVTTETLTSTTTASTTPPPPVTTTTTGTTAVPSPTATPTERTTTTTPTSTSSTTRTSPTPTTGATTSTPTATVPTSASSTTITSRTTPGSTTTPTTTSAHTETSTVTSKTPTSTTTASTISHPPATTTTTGTTAVPSPTATPTERTTTTTPTTTAITTRTAPTPTSGETTTSTPTATVPTSSSSTTSTSRTTPGRTTTPTTTSAHTETSTVTSKSPASTTAASTTSTLSTTTTGTTAVPSPTATPTERTTTTTPTATVPTSASSTTSTSRTTPGSTTTPTTTSAHTETSTVTSKTPTSTTTASTTSPLSTTTTGTTAVPSPTATPTERTTRTTPTTTASTTSISPTSTPTSGTSTSTPTPTVPTTSPTNPSHIPHSTTSCCAWTQWFDVDSPQPGSENGDIETFAKIRAAGYDLCDKPQGIECRAKDYPDRDLDKLGQKFECTLDAGLVCRNKDQIKKYPMCFNYEIRVLCCDRDGCTTASPPTTSAGPSTTVSSTETSTVTTKTLTSTTTASTTPPPPVTTTTTGTTAVPSPTATPTERTTTTTPTATVPTSASSTTITSRTTPGSTTTPTTTSAHTETSTVTSKTPTSTTTASTISHPPATTTTTGTTAVPSPTATPTERTTTTTPTSTSSTTRTSPTPTSGATTSTPTATVPTSSSSTTSTSRTTPGSTTTPTTTSAHTETSTVTSKTTRAPSTASTISHPPATTTSTGTTAVPSPTATPTERTTTTTPTSTSSTTRTSPTPTTGETTTSTPTATVPTSSSSTKSTSRTTPGSTTTPTTTSAHTETSTVTSKTPTSTTTASTISHPPATTTTTGTTAVPSPTLTPTERTTTTTPTTTASTTRTSPTPTTGAITTSTPTPTVPTTSPTNPSHIPHSTTSCCAWTQWFDVDSPQPGSENGDIETFAKIRAAGYDLCDKPQGIECRAKDYPDRDLDKLGQKFECSLDAGLVCRNKDQIKKYPMCFNYEIRVLCCDRDGCTTASPPTTSAGPSTTVSSTETSTVTTETLTSTTTASTTPPPPVTTTTTGTTAVPSPTATPTERTTTTTPTSTSSTTRTSPTPTSGATTSTPTATVPTSASSTTSTSRTTPGRTTTPTTTSAHTETSTVTSKTPTSTTTASTISHPPATTTTTGTTAVPSPTATPTERTTTTTPTSTSSTTRTSPTPTTGETTTSTPTATVPTSASSTISTSRTTPGSSTTPMTTTAHTETSTVTSKTPTSTTTASTTSTLSTTTTGTTAVPSPTVTPTSTSSTTGTSPTPTTGATTSTPTATVPTSARRTTSTSRTTPGSTTVTMTMSAHTETSIVTIKTPTAPTTASTQLATTSTRGRTVATTGTSQSSHVITNTSAISSLSPSTPVTTEASTYVTSSRTTPCFCHMYGNLFSPGELVYTITDAAGCKVYGLCSEECEIAPTLGPCPPTTPGTTTATTLTTPAGRNCTDVNPSRKPGENWTSECQECVCDPHTATTRCQPVLCQSVRPPECELGFYLETVKPPKDPCCPEFKCKAFNDSCVHNGTPYKVGMSVVNDSCVNCTCTSEKDPVTKANIMRCERVQCETSCPPGHQYTTEDGKCCGKCVPVACSIQLGNGTIHVLNVDDILVLDHCSHYKCEKIEDQFVAVQTKKVCPEYNPKECDPDETETTPDGCCKICKRQTCKVHSKTTVIHHSDCESSEPVELAYCQGTCPGFSIYSFEANQMQHECSCCQELSSHRREVTLTCQNGTSINYNYVYVEQCLCMTACTAETSAAPGSPGKSQQKREKVAWKSKQAP